jgi:hypothetical protein
LHSPEPLEFIKNIPSSQQEDIHAVIEAYTQRVADLFLETGDDLSIPRKIYLHTDLQSEPFFKHIISQAGIRVLKSTPQVSVVTPLITDKINRVAGNQNSDTAMLVSAMFFHIQNTRRTLEYL